MKRTTMNCTTGLRTLLGASLAISLSACGGGMPSFGGFEDGPESVSGPSALAPVEGLTDADYLALQSRGIVPAAGKPQQFTSLAMTSMTGVAFDGPVGRDAGTLTINEEKTWDGPDLPGVRMVAGDSTGHRNSFHPGYDNGTSQHGEQLIDGETLDVGGQTAFAGIRKPSLDMADIFYLPAADSDMWVGGYVESEGFYGRGYHGIFGRESTQAEVASRVGSASYSGLGMASVSRNHRVDPGENGLYLGTSEATIDFHRNTLSMRADLSRERQYSSGTDRITMLAQGTILEGGQLSGTTVFEGLVVNGTAVRGDIEGHLFGPDAQSLGATFIGFDEEDRDGIYGSIVGHATLNEQR